MTKTPILLDPKILSFWIRCIRETQHMSQDALAESSGVDIRTIQRMEAGNQVSVTTQRCLARGLGYDNHDIFDDPQFAMNVHSILESAQTINQEAVEKQHPDHVRVQVERVMNGETLGRFADAANAISLNADDELSLEAKQAAATLFDYIRDLIDVGNDASFSEKLAYSQALETLLRELEGLGTIVYLAFRSMKLANDTWADKTPIPVKIGYLTVAPAEKVLTDMFVPRRAQMGF
jgi:transcriptional regulator with XRE-family HTH domain